MQSQKRLNVAFRLEHSNLNDLFNPNDLFNLKVRFSLDLSA